MPARQQHLPLSRRVQRQQKRSQPQEGSLACEKRWRWWTTSGDDKAHTTGQARATASASVSCTRAHAQSAFAFFMQARRNRRPRRRDQAATPSLLLFLFGYAFAGVHECTRLFRTSCFKNQSSSLKNDTWAAHRSTCLREVQGESPGGARMHIHHAHSWRPAHGFSAHHIYLTRPQSHTHLSISSSAAATDTRRAHIAAEQYTQVDGQTLKVQSEHQSSTINYLLCTQCTRNTNARGIHLPQGRKPPLADETGGAGIWTGGTRTATPNPPTPRLTS